MAADAKRSLLSPVAAHNRRAATEHSLSSALWMAAVYRWVRKVDCPPWSRCNFSVSCGSNLIRLHNFVRQPPAHFMVLWETKGKFLLWRELLSPSPLQEPLAVLCNQMWSSLYQRGCLMHKHYLPLTHCRVVSNYYEDWFSKNDWSIPPKGVARHRWNSTNVQCPTVASIK